MQQLTVQNQLDFSNLQPLAPQQNSFNRNDSYLSKSFSDFMNEAKSASDAVSGSEPKKVPESEKVVQKNDEKFENAEKKSEVSKKEDSEIPEEKSVLKESEKIDEKLTEKIQKKTFAKNDESEKSENARKTDFNQINPENIKEISEKTLKKSEVKNSKEEKTLKSEQKTKNQPENEDFTLENSVVASGSAAEFLNEKVTFDSSNFEISDFAGEDSEKIGEIDAKTEKTFFLDKDKKISVQDFRSENTEKNTAEKNIKSSVEISEIRRDEKNFPQVTMEFAAASANQNIVSSDNQTAGANGSNFQAMLSNQIQENAGEIVKAGNIVLKDNDVGSIKLILHPESLGNVKIDLSLHEKNISGKIIVATQEAFNAFKETAENLKQAFTQSGFDSAGLELSLANQGFSHNHSGENQNNPAAEFAMRKIYGELNIFSEENFEEIENLEISSRNSVNIVA